MPLRKTFSSIYSSWSCRRIGVSGIGEKPEKNTQLKKEEVLSVMYIIYEIL